MAESAGAIADPETDKPESEDGGQVVLFNKARFEGQKVTDYALSFGGNIQIGDPDLVKALTLGAEVTLRIQGHVQSRGHKMKDGKDSKGAVSSATLVVESVTLDE